MYRRLRRAVALLAVTTLLGSALVLVTGGTAEAAGRTLQRGSRGPAVTLLESRLHRLRLLPRAAVDRRYTRATVRAVKRFQRQQHVRATGRADRRTWNLVARRVATRKTTRPVTKPTPTPAPTPAPSAPAPLVVGHRGTMHPSVPENTLAAMRLGHRSADILEFDLQFTADHVPVLMHDETLERTTNCTGMVMEWTAAALRATCRAGDQPIPTFTEVAQFAETERARIAPELKDPEVSDADLRTVFGIIERHHLEDLTLLKSFTVPIVEQVHRLRPDLPLMLTAVRPPSVAAVRATGAGTIAVRQDHLTATDVARYRNAGLKVWTYTALNKTELARARDLQVDAVCTDVPAVAADFYR